MTDTEPTTALTPQDLLDYCNPDGYGGQQVEVDKFVTDCLARATALVAAYVGSVSVPAVVIAEAVLEAGSELYFRRKSPQGVAQFGSVDGAPNVYTARDPLVRTYPILDQFVPRGLA